MNNNKGFTLIEVLISVTLLAFVMLGITTTSENAIFTKERVTKEDNKFFQVETALSRIQWDIEHAYSPLYFSIPMKVTETATEEQLEAYNNFIQRYQNNARFNQVSYEALPIPKNELDEKSTFTFFTAANRRKFQNQKQSHYAWVKYDLVNIDSEDDLEDDQKSFSGTKYLTRQLLADNVFDSEEIPWDDIRSQTLLRNVTSFKIHFWDYSKAKWQESLRTVQNGESIIYGVKLIIEIKIEEDLTKVIEKVIRPLFPKFTPEDYYDMIQVTDENFINGIYTPEDGLE